MSVTSVVETIDLKKPEVVVDTLRLIELSDRTSAAMKSSAVDPLKDTDPLLGIFRVFGELNREIQSWPQSQSQLHVTSKLRHVYYPMSKVWSEHEYSVQKLSSSVDFQIMLMSCVQKKVLSTEGIYH